MTESKKCTIEVWGRYTLLIMDDSGGYRLAGPKAFGQKQTAAIQVDVDELIKEATAIKNRGLPKVPKPATFTLDQVEDMIIAHGDQFMSSKHLCELVERLKKQYGDSND